MASNPATPRPACQPKQMSSRLLTMKFMQRSVSSPISTPVTPASEPPSAKRQKLGHDSLSLPASSASTPAVSTTPPTQEHYSIFGDKRAISRAVRAQNDLESMLRAKNAVDGAETEWYVFFPDQGLNGVDTNGRGEKDEGEGGEEDDDEDDIWAPSSVGGGRQTFGAFKAPKSKTRAGPDSDFKDVNGSQGPGYEQTSSTPPSASGSSSASSSPRRRRRKRSPSAGGGASESDEVDRYAPDRARAGARKRQKMSTSTRRRGPPDPSVVAPGNGTGGMGNHDDGDEDDVDRAVFEGHTLKKMKTGASPHARKKKDGDDDDDDNGDARRDARGSASGTTGPGHEYRQGYKARSPATRPLTALSQTPRQKQAPSQFVAGAEYIGLNGARDRNRNRNRERHRPRS